MSSIKLHTFYPIFITLPNDNKILAIIVGIVIFFVDFLLFDFLYIPSFHFNILPVPKLISFSPCGCIFNKNIYFIQNLDSWKTIGIVKIHNGLYGFQHANHKVFSIIVPSFDVWHYRFGYPSTSKL